MKHFLTLIASLLLLTLSVSDAFAGDGQVPCGDPKAMFKVNCDIYQKQTNPDSTSITSVTPPPPNAQVGSSADPVSVGADISFFGLKYASQGALAATTAANIFMSFNGALDSLKIVGSIVGKIKEAHEATLSHYAAKVYFNRPVRFMRIPESHKQIMKLLGNKNKDISSDCDWEVEVKQNEISAEGRLASLLLLMTYPKSNDSLKEDDKCSPLKGEAFFTETANDLAARMAKGTVYKSDM